MSIIASIDDNMNMEEVDSSNGVPSNMVYQPLRGHAKQGLLRSLHISQATYGILEEGNKVEFFLTRTP